MTINQAVEVLGDPWAVLVLVALGCWGPAHRDGERRLRIRAEVLRDGGPELLDHFMDELRHIRLDVP